MCIVAVTTALDLSINLSYQITCVVLSVAAALVRQCAAVEANHGGCKPEAVASQIACSKRILYVQPALCVCKQLADSQQYFSTMGCVISEAQTCKQLSSTKKW
jgi:hypothetical protein